MSEIMVGLGGAVGSVALFSFLAFCVWIDYRKKKDERDAVHQERIKALELGYAPSDAEIERARAYSSAAWAAGVIGLVVPIVVVSLGIAATIVAVLYHKEGEDLGTPLCIAWSIGGVIMLVTIVRTLGTIRQLPRPTADVPPRGPGKRADPGSGEFQEKRLEL